MEEIIIPLSKKKIISLFILSLFFIAIGFGIIWIYDDQNLRNVRIFVTGFAIIDILFFGLCGLYSCVKIFDRKPGLVVNNNGIIDNSSFMSVGLVKWENITDVRVTDVVIDLGVVRHNQKILTIEVNNAKEIIGSQKSFKRFLMSLNNNFYKSPIQISSVGLKCSFQELHNILKEQLSIHRKVT